MAMLETDENLMKEEIVESKKHPSFGVNIEMNNSSDKLTKILGKLGKEFLSNQIVGEKEAAGLEEALSSLQYEYPNGRPMSLEAIVGERNFLRNTFEIWANKETADKAKIIAGAISPKDQEWQIRSEDIDTEKFGEYTPNPETSGLTSADFERMAEEGKVKVEALPSRFNNKPLYEAAKYIVETYSGKYYLPGIEYWQWLLANPDKSPEACKDGGWHFLFGSLLRDSRGHWRVPFLHWDGSSWNRYADWLDDTWSSNYRVVLLER